MEASAGAGAGSDGKGGNVNLLTAYFLYCIGGVFGMHHAYLHRPHQALAWYASAGLCGCGLLRDFFRLPSYVALARDDRARDVTARVRAATVAARDGVPRMSMSRIVLMWAFGAFFGLLASCLVVLPAGDGGADDSGVAPWWVDAAYGVLRAVGAAAGVWLVGNAGEEAVRATPDGGGGGRAFARLAAWCLASGALVGHPVFGGLTYAVRHRRFKVSMCPPPSAAPSAARRVGRHLLLCAAYTALLAVAAYNHGSVTVSGAAATRTIYLHDVLRNAYRSEFWKEFDWEEFREGVGAGGEEGGEYLKSMFDVAGERGARRVLGVARDASHAEVRSAYKRLALKYHPDKVGAYASEREVEETQRQFMRVQEAYDLLSDLEHARKKKAEDSAGASQRRHGNIRTGTDEM